MPGMNFGQGAKNFKINGGNFNNIDGDYTVYNDVSVETNLNPWNGHDDRTSGPNNDNFQRFGGRPREDRASYTDDHGEASYGGPPSPPSQRPQFPPRQGSSTHGHVSNPYKRDTGSDDGYSRPHQYHDRAPPSNERRPRRSQEQSMYRDEEEKFPDVAEDEYPESYTAKSFGNGKTKASVQRPSRSKSRPRVVGVHSSPSSVVNSPIVQRMDPNTRQAFSQATKRTQSQWLEENDKQSMAGNTIIDEDEDSDNSGHFSSHDIDEQDSMSTRMANSSIRDPISPHRPNGTYHPQPASRSSPYPPNITRKTSESNRLHRPQTDHTMGSSDLRQAGTLHHSISAPSSSKAPQMEEPVMDNKPIVDSSGPKPKRVRKRDFIKRWLQHV